MDRLALVRLQRKLTPMGRSLFLCRSSSLCQSGLVAGALWDSPRAYVCVYTRTNGMLVKRTRRQTALCVCLANLAAECKSVRRLYSGDGHEHVYIYIHIRARAHPPNGRTYFQRNDVSG